METTLLCRRGNMIALMMIVRMMIDQPQLPTYPFTHLSDRSSGTTITANMPKLIARVASVSIAARTSKSFGPAKNLIGASVRCGSMEYDTRVRAASFVSGGGGTVTG